jgi:hypothetical protein
MTVKSENHKISGSDSEASPYRSFSLFLHGEATTVLPRQRNCDGIRCNESGGSGLLYARRIQE